MPNITNLFMNWTGVTVTPEGGSAITIKHVTDIMIDGRSVQEAFYGDARKFAALIRNVQHTRTLQIKSGDATNIALIPLNTPCTVAAILNHAEGGAGAGSGALSISLVNGMCGGKNIGGTNNKFAAPGCAFSAYAGATDTDPLTITVL